MVEHPAQAPMLLLSGTANRPLAEEKSVAVIEECGADVLRDRIILECRSGPAGEGPVPPLD